MKRPLFQKLDTNTLVMLKQVGLGFLVILGTALILTTVWYGTRLEALTISQIEVQGGETISHDKVNQLVAAQLEGEFAGFIPKAFAWLYPKKEIISAVSAVERIHSIKVERTSGSALLVSFEEYLPEALWCKTLRAIECVFIDAQGRAYGTSPNLAGGSLVRFIHTSQAPKKGKLLTSAEDFQLLQRLTQLLEENRWYVSHVEIDKVRDAFLHIVDGGEFKVTLTQDPEVTVNNLNAVLTSEEFNGLQPGNFQYIDLRFGNKVFVNEEAPADEVVSTEVESEAESADSGEGTDPETETAASLDAAEE
jgi:hypothetical protein